MDSRASDGSGVQRCGVLRKAAINALRAGRRRHDDASRGQHGAAPLLIVVLQARASACRASPGLLFLCVLSRRGRAALGSGASCRSRKLGHPVKRQSAVGGPPPCSCRMSHAKSMPLFNPGLEQQRPMGRLERVPESTARGERVQDARTRGVQCTPMGRGLRCVIGDGSFRPTEEFSGNDTASHRHGFSPLAHQGTYRASSSRRRLRDAPSP